MVERNMASAAGVVMRGAGCPAGVKEHITRTRSVSELGISRVWPSGVGQFVAYGGPHREGEEP
jgi:hypothetical protein